MFRPCHPGIGSRVSIVAISKTVVIARPRASGRRVQPQTPAIEVVAHDRNAGATGVAHQALQALHLLLLLRTIEQDVGPEVRREIFQRRES